MTTGQEISQSLRGFGTAVAQCFKVVMWLGIAANVVTAVISIIWTDTVLNLLHIEIAQPLIWPRFAAFLLILLSMFYLPAAIDPLYYRYSAVVAVICRFAGFGFFTIVGGRYIIFGLFDLTFGLPQAVLLFFAWKLSQPGGTAR
jgi:hypothetical protein